MAEEEKPVVKITRYRSKRRHDTILGEMTEGDITWPEGTTDNMDHIESWLEILTLLKDGFTIKVTEE